MLKPKKRIWIALVLCLGISVMGVGKLWFILNGKKSVGPRQLQVYSETYLRKYNGLVEKAAPLLYRNHFPDYTEGAFLINAIISSSHGAALEFIPSEDSKFQCRTVTNRIDQVVFPEKDPNTSKVLKTKSVIENLGFPSVSGFRVSAKNISMTRLSIGEILLFETGSLRTREIAVRGIDYLNTIIIKGRNQRKAWSRKEAKRDAMAFFRSDYKSAYLDSEEFRMLTATPELTKIAKEIISKREKGEYGGEQGFILFRQDLAILIAKATVHGINPEFAKSIYKFLEKEKTWFERHPLLLTLIGCVIFAVLVWLFKWGYWRFITFMQSNS